MRMKKKMPTDFYDSGLVSQRDLQKLGCISANAKLILAAFNISRGKI